MITLDINGEARSVDADPATPLLWVLRDTLGLTGTKFGCGIALCGACTVHVDGKPVRSCSTPCRWPRARRSRPSRASAPRPSARRCRRPGRRWTCRSAGYCQVGQIMSAAALLAVKPQPTERRHRHRHGRNICRCGTYSAHPRRHPQGGRAEGGMTWNPSSTSLAAIS